MQNILIFQKINDEQNETCTEEEFLALQLASEVVNNGRGNGVLEAWIGFRSALLLSDDRLGRGQ